MNRDEKIATISAFFVSVVCVLLIFFFIVMEQVNTNSYSRLFLMDGGYRNEIVNDSVSLKYGIENQEQKDLSYAVEYYIGDIKIMDETVKVQKGTSKILNKQLSVRSIQPILPLKLTIKARNETGEEYSVWFWLKRRA